MWALIPCGSVPFKKRRSNDKVRRESYTTFDRESASRISGKFDPWRSLVKAKKRSLAGATAEATAECEPPQNPPPPPQHPQAGFRAT